MWVKNVREEEGRTCPCVTRLEHWGKGSRSEVVYCGRTMCVKNARLGALVTKADGPDRGEYVVPLCPECSRMTEAFEVAISLVPAGEQVFCRSQGRASRDVRALREREKILSAL